MRHQFPIFAAVLLATPAVAQEPVKPEAEATAPSPQLPKELTDPAMADRLVAMMQALSKAMLDLPVGEMQAAVEGRPATAADKSKTVRSEKRLSERELQQQIASSRPMMQASMKAMAAALPSLIDGMSKAAEEMEKATANLPSPTYPRQ